MPSNQVKELKSWLETKHIKVSYEWITACLSWISEQNQDQRLSPEQVKDALYTQWLYSDLQNLECASLPPGLFTTEKYFLEGRYALQINYMYDISRSAYSQLTKVTGLTNENAEVTAAPTDEPPPPWEVKPTRMLLVNLTDGVNSIDGFEFVPVPSLHFSLPPGTKVVIQGPVECLGQKLFLRPNNVQVLGGGVEELLVENSQEQLLSRLLGEAGPAHPVPAATFETAAPGLPELNDADDDIFRDQLLIERIDQQVQETLSQVEGTTRELAEPSFPEDEIDEDLLQEHYNLQDLTTQEMYPSFTRTLSLKDIYTEQARPYTYLALIRDKLELQAPVVIKGFIVTLVSKLELTSGKWSIQAIVTDGSASLHLSLHDQLLSKLIGYTAQEVMNIKSRQNQELKKSVMAAIQGCQKRLLHLSGLLEIRHIEGRFYLTDAQDVAQQHLDQLTRRVADASTATQ